MTAAEIRQSFFDFFREKEHTIVPSASLLPDSPNLLFTNAGMNQFVPIFLGQQKPAWDPPRVADTQKCIRAGGKHNDLDDVGLDTYHHTFFEMLGNWSFGDYFKKEAIEWAWELVAERWRLPAARLYATVYRPGPGEPSEFDQEAHDHWARLFERAGLDPAIHVVDGNKKDNFWMMGDTGPCGPCSELHVDLTPAGDTKGSLVNAGDARCIEIWNLVFIQFNANADGTFSPLPQRHVDTGMGLERITAMIQGTKNFTDFSGLVSNYETDVFRPIFDEIEKLSGKKYASTLPIVGQALRLPGEEAGSRNNDEQEKIDIAFRVIADHIRTLSFAIADGIQPSNEGRGYVLRRILRRAVRYGRTLGFHEPFFFRLVDVLVRTMGDVFPELRRQRDLISETLRREEEGFNKTLDKGIALFEGQISRLDAGTVSGAFAFRLYDEQGFPFDLTELMARERGLAIDREGFECLMEEQRSRARSAQKKTAIELAGGEGDFATTFLGYEHDHTGADVVLVTSAKGKAAVILNNSVCYAEMGGQVGDRGTMAAGDRRWTISNTQKSGAAFVHQLEAEDAPEPGAHVTVEVDVPRRRAIERHHSVTHLLHWALHEKVSKDAVQKGSYVGPEKLTFDFSSAALTPEQKRQVEDLVNEKVKENANVSWTEVPYSEAKKRSDIQQFFGDKYGETVRVVQIGGEPGKLNGYSMELCGGTHVRATGDIGSFRILREEAIAAGIRRIEAVAGDAAKEWAKAEAARQQEKFEALAGKKSGVAALPAFAGNAETAAMLQQIDLRAAHLGRLEAEVHEWQKQQAKASEADMKGRAAAIAKELRAAHSNEKAIVAAVPESDGKLLQGVVDSLKSHFAGPIFLAGALDGRVALIASVPKELTAQFQANKLIQEIAPLVGGKGGGRPDNAQGAGKDSSKIDAALARARELLL
ncbi:MAG TPA: alanine--tRNA ligase [Chthoniobacterales bacterium]|nr:alanine--tRNA ligase [Chthoniobacterales bacterium]